MITFEWNNVKFSVTDIGGGKLTEDIPRHSHASQCYELHFITEGNGTLMIDDKVYKLHKGNFFITGPGIYHSQTANNVKPVEDVFIMLQAKNINKANVISSIFLATHFCFLETFDFYVSKEILFEYKKADIDFESIVAGLCMKELSMITRRLLPKGITISTINDNLNDRRFVIIEQSFLYDKDLTLSSLSQRIGLCDRQTQRLLKKYYGKSFREIKKDSKK